MVTWPAYWPTVRPLPLAETEMVPGVVPLVGVTESQVRPDGVVEAAAVKLRGAGEPVILTVCAAGAGPPAACVKLKVAVGAEIVPGETVTVTLMVAGLLPAPGEVTVIEPLYVPGVVSLLPSTEIVSVPLLLVLPLVGVTLSHGVGVVVLATAVKIRGGGLLRPTVTVCGAGFGPPMVYEKLAEVALSVSDPEVTVRVAGKVSGGGGIARRASVGAGRAVPLL